MLVLAEGGEEKVFFGISDGHPDTGGRLRSVQLVSATDLGSIRRFIKTGNGARAGREIEISADSGSPAATVLKILRVVFETVDGAPPILIVPPKQMRARFRE